MAFEFRPEDLPEPTPRVKFQDPRNERFLGKIIRVKDKWRNKNPCHPTKRGKGWKAFNLLLANGGEMTYEEYRRQGGRNDHLDWDLAQHYNRKSINDEKYIEIIDKHSG